MTVEELATLLERARAPTPPSKPWAYWFSNAGDPCLRALVYDAHDADDGKPQARKPGPLKWLLAAECGRAVGDFIEGAARQIGYVTQKRHVFDTSGLIVSGHSDLIGRDAVTDIKLVGEKKWARVATRPDPGHVLQANGYAVQNDSPRWGLLYIRGASIFDADAEEIETKLYSGVADLALAQELCATWEQVHAHRKLRTLPERVFGASPTKYPCGWCRHLERCAPEENP